MTDREQLEVRILTYTRENALEQGGHRTDGAVDINAVVEKLGASRGEAVDAIMSLEAQGLLEVYSSPYEGESYCLSPAGMRAAITGTSPAAASPLTVNIGAMFVGDHNTAMIQQTIAQNPGAVLSKLDELAVLIDRHEDSEQSQAAQGALEELEKQVEAGEDADPSYVRRLLGDLAAFLREDVPALAAVAQLAQIFLGGSR